MNFNAKLWSLPISLIFWAVLILSAVFKAHLAPRGLTLLSNNCYQSHNYGSRIELVMMYLMSRQRQLVEASQTTTTRGRRRDKRFHVDASTNSIQQVVLADWGLVSPTGGQMAPPARDALHSQQECAYGSMSVPVAVHGALGGARAGIGACGWRDRADTHVVHRCAQAGLLLSTGMA